MQRKDADWRVAITTSLLNYLLTLTTRSALGTSSCLMTHFGGSRSILSGALHPAGARYGSGATELEVCQRNHILRMK